MGIAEVDFGNGEIWRGDERELFSGLCEDVHPFICSKYDAEGRRWLFKGNYRSSWDDVHGYFRLDKILGLCAGPQLRRGRFRCSEKHEWQDVYLEEAVELKPIAGSLVASSLSVRSLWGESGPHSVSVYSSICGAPNVTWKTAVNLPADRAHGHMPIHTQLLVPLLDLISFQRCAISHLVYHRSTNLADLLLRTCASRPDQIELVLGDVKKCFWPSAGAERFWVRFKQVFHTMADRPLKLEIHRLLLSWQDVVLHIPEDIPLREQITHRLSTLSLYARQRPPERISIMDLGHLLLEDSDASS